MGSFSRAAAASDLWQFETSFEWLILVEATVFASMFLHWVGFCQIWLTKCLLLMEYGNIFTTAVSEQDLMGSFWNHCSAMEETNFCWVSISLVIISMNLGSCSAVVGGHVVLCRANHSISPDTNSKLPLKIGL